ncbi:LAMA2 [Symbiodinium pilosum]|uniref:LAMA2 protein n=1 Tax=Symbiodinium pilosum TaxID=2952 RepID=A0A812WF59_SYMPI|nr:LAMA2 [Symbiodinium pilosum]
MAGGAVEHSLEYGGAVGLGSVSAQKLWKNTAEESEPRPLQIEYNSGMSIEDSEICEDLGLPGHQKVAETVFEDPEEANIRPRLLVPLQSVLGLKALCEREYIRTETVTEMLNQCRTAYYKELLYLREQLILAAEPEKQMLLASVQNYEVYYFNPPAYVDEDLKEYMMNCSRWTHKKLIEENYELQMKLAGQEDVFENADFCLKGLLRRHGTYRMFKTMHNIVRNAKDLFNPEDMIRKKETEGLKPIDELQAAVIEVFPNLKAKEDNSAILLAEIEELQKSVTDLRAELAKVKDLLEKERSRADDLSRQCEEHMKNKPAAAQVEVVKEVDNEATLEELRQMKDLKQRLEQEAQAQARRLHKQVEEFAAAKSLQPGHASADPSKLVPKLDEAILEAEQLLQAAASLTSQVTVSKVQATTKQVVDRSAEEKALKEVQQLKQQLEVLTAKLAAAEKREQDALQKLKELQNKKPEKVERPESAGPAVPGDYDELKDRLERKLARIAELEADLDQAKRDLRAANRKVEEQELLLQERARKDAEKAKQMSDLMEKLRKSEEEAENLAGKLYKAQEKIKKLKEEIRELKNKLGIAVQESEEEEEEEVDNSPHFMSRYYLRAKNSGKPRWMLLSEDAKLKSQRTEHMQQQAHHSVSSNFQAANALQFLRRAPSSESQKPRGVRLQYGDTQEWYPPEMGMGMGGFGDGTPHAPHAGGFSRQSSFQMGHTFTDGSAASPGGRRLMTSGSTTFSPGDASPQQFHSFSRQGTASMAGFGRNQAGSPLMAGGNSRQSTPTGSALVHPMLGMPQGLPQGPLQGLPQGLPQGLAQGLPQGMSFSGSRAAAPAGTGSWQVSGPGMSTSGLSYRPGLAPSGSYSSYHIVGQRQGTPPTGVAELLGGPRVAASFSPTSAGAGEIAASARSNMQGTVIQGTATSTHASSVLPPQVRQNATVEGFGSTTPALPHRTLTDEMKSIA